MSHRSHCQEKYWPAVLKKTIIKENRDKRWTSEASYFFYLNVQTYGRIQSYLHLKDMQQEHKNKGIEELLRNKRCN